MHILRYVTGLGGGGCSRSCELASHAHLTLRHWVGGVGHVNVHVNLRHMHILGYVTGLGGWGMLTFMLTCVACTSYVTSLGLGGGACSRSCELASHAHLTLRHWVGGVGDVNIHVNLRHMHILRYVTGLGGWGMLTFMLTCVTCTSYVTSLGWGGGAC